MNVETIKEMVDRGVLKELHTASERGYVSRKFTEGTVSSYKGKFGVGFIIRRPRWDSTMYCYRTYYVYN